MAVPATGAQTSRSVLRLKRGRDRAWWHPWIFKGDVADVSDVAAGSAVTVIDADGRFVGRGFYNPRPALCCRILTRDDEPLDAGFFRRRVSAAVARRAGDGGASRLGRLVWSEGDELPGFIADRYGDVLVVQCLTLGMAASRDALVRALRAAVGDLAVFSMDEPAAARLEGFEAARGWLDRAGPVSEVVHEGAVALRVTFGTGHKTGLYLDQRENRLLAGRLAAGRRVLDVFSYTGGFVCHALRGGAVAAVCLESSPEAIQAARDNFALNDARERARIIDGNAFDNLRRLEREGERFGLIVLDPPPFARRRDALDAAARGYKEVNLRAMRLLAPGGRLLTFSCSHHVSEAALEEICREAAADAGVTLRIAQRLSQSADHPVLLTVPETRYLKGLLLEAD